MSDKTRQGFDRLMDEANKIKAEIPIYLTVHEYAMLVASLGEALDDRMGLPLEIKEQIRRLLKSVRTQALAWRETQERTPSAISTSSAPAPIGGDEFPAARKRNTR